MKTAPEMLFVCVHNAGRSHMTADVVITMGCGDACPIYPAKRYLNWELDDLAGKTLEQIHPSRADIDRRVRAGELGSGAKYCRATCPPAKRCLNCLDPGQTPWLNIYHP